MKLIKAILFCSAFILTNIAQAECSFKILNHSGKSFEELKAKASISNLAIPICIYNPQIESDALTKANCAPAPNNILFEHPVTAVTCQATNGWKVYIQFESQTKTCTSKKPQSTIDRHVVLNYPEDFDCQN